mmetsp:Transcript_29753/g.36455  ORF Transcript_29753/g.36455 Transcript_29753/m.36455 type:complete len:92 (+) Transcript_29753:1-276(+)
MVSCFEIPIILWLLTALLSLNVSATKQVLKSFEFWLKTFYGIQMIVGIYVYVFKHNGNIELFGLFTFLGFTWIGMFDASNIKTGYKVIICL